MSYKSLLSEVNAGKKTPTKAQLEALKAKADDHELIKRRKDLVYDQKQLATKMGISYAEWLKQANTYYSISNDYTVTSNAKSPTSISTWDNPDLISAQEKIYQLINYKYYDHFIKGWDFAW